MALSTDASMLEEYLRSSETPPKPLRETVGLSDASQKVTGPGTSLFGFENQAETMRAMFETLRKDASGSNGELSPFAALGSSGPGKIFEEWMDFSLLPPYEKVSKYFGISVYAGSATVDGMSLKVFAPVPPGLKK
jgi:hypothetical protein